jgi:hypothetical protein
MSRTGGDRARIIPSQRVDAPPDRFRESIQEIACFLFPLHEIPDRNREPARKRSGYVPSSHSLRRNIRARRSAAFPSRILNLEEIGGRVRATSGRDDQCPNRNRSRFSVRRPDNPFPRGISEFRSNPGDWFSPNPSLGRDRKIDRAGRSGTIRRID